MFMMHELGHRQPFVFENFVALRAPPQIKNKLILCSVSLMLCVVALIQKCGATPPLVYDRPI